VARARARLEITEAEAANCMDFNHNHDRAAAIIVIAHAAAKLAQAIGIVWHASGRAVSVEALDQLVAELVDGRAPASLWLGCSPAPETAGRLMTRGLYPLLGGEIEVASTALAAEILASGESPAENETIEFDARTAFHVGYRQGGDEGAIPAIVLTHVPRQSDVERAAGAA